jgi:ABC-type branched-subunit amino acid transport system permease subunit
MLRDGIRKIVKFKHSKTFLLSLVLLGLVYLLASYMVRSGFGRALKAIRDDETVAQVFGYRTSHFKLLIFTVSAGLAAVAGSLFATYITFIDPSTFNLNESIVILAMIILGGLASLRGALLGAFFADCLARGFALCRFSQRCRSSTKASQLWPFAHNLYALPPSRSLGGV